jgi:predicted esterase
MSLALLYSHSCSLQIRQFAFRERIFSKITNPTKFCSSAPTRLNSGNMKILMLHGYTQNGPLFHAKTKVLEKYLKKLYPDLTLSYPTGPLRLRPEDVPGFESSGNMPDDLEAYGWWRRSNTADPPEYAGIGDAFDMIAKLIAIEGPFDGVMGFSQGAALATMITSLLERPSRQDAFKRAKETSALAIDYPASFENLQQQPLKFLVSYCGFRAPGERYNGFYEDPTIQTPSCHVNGSLDTLVEESRWRTLMEACGGEGMTRLVIHPGGHFVPSGKQYLETVADFIRTSMSPANAGAVAKEEEKAEDMDMPF